MKWMVYSLISLFFCVLLVLCIKFATLKNIPSEVILFYIMLFALFIFGYKYTRSGFKFDNMYHLILLAFAGICSYFANNFNVKAIGLAPNPSYAHAISDMRLIPVAILSMIFFNSTLSIKGIIGIILCFIGCFLLLT